ncbi:hypothetical protein PI125_g15481 [Phytophthora idaei]|nr:hypothetical protein PI125_g15481 [Phytophthora idaei]
MALTLTSVSLVLHAQRDGHALHQVGPLISTFLGPPTNLSLAEACTFDSLNLLDWLWSLSCTSVALRTQRWSLINYLRSEPHYYQWQFWKSMRIAAEVGDVEVVKWIFSHFSSCVVPIEMVDIAAKNGHL